jgi:hypothetical protein
MDLPADVYATHADLSDTARRFLDYVQDHVECRRRLDYGRVEYPQWLRRYGGEYHPVQTWPTFVGEGRLAELRRATLGVTRLIKSLPHRVFGDDPGRIARFYNLRNEFLAALILAPPNGIAAASTRIDWIDSLSGFKCTEVNAGNMAGWEMRFFVDACLAHPPTARFIAAERISVHYRDPFRMLLRHVVEESLAQPLDASGTINVCIAIPGFSPQTDSSMRIFDQAYRELLHEDGRGLAGRLVICSYNDVAARGGRLWYRDLPLHGLIEQTSTSAPDFAFRCFKAERIKLYNGPIGQILGDKRNLALLSQLADTGLFDAEERAIIHAHVPWSREVIEQEASFGGDSGPLRELILRHRERLVLKPAFSSRGKGVAIGSHVEQDAWARLVASAFEQGSRWLVQEKLVARPYLFQHGEEGMAIHDTVWGLFCFGAAYGGGYLRMIPRGGLSGVINSARGAIEGVVLETSPGA